MSGAKPVELMNENGRYIYGIIHVGANMGQESVHYAEHGIVPCLYVEPVDSTFERLKSNIAGRAGHYPIQAVCSETYGETVEFNISSNDGLSSSLLGLGRHATLLPDIKYIGTQRMQTTTVDRLLESLDLTVAPNLMVIDTQGAELKVLKGSAESLKKMDAVFVEISETPLYDGGATHDEVTDLLRQFGFRLRWMELNNSGVGDAFYLNYGLKWPELPTYEGNRALGKSTSQSSYYPFPFDSQPQGAVSGTKTGYYGFHTNLDYSPWWQVDLGSSQALNEIRIFNRLDSGRERSRTLQVLVSETGEPGSWVLKHNHDGATFGGTDGRPLRVFPNSTARFVRVQLNEHAYLHLDEVEVY